MKHLILFEEWNKERFDSKEASNDYYRNINPIKSVEERTYNIEDIKKFDIPDGIIEKMKSWEVIVKSPYSDTFYNSTEINWNYKPDMSFRVSDHWNFEAKGKKHCITDKPVKNTHISIGQYDRKMGKYKILLTLPKPSFIKKIELGRKKKEFMQNPEIITQKKEFKSRIENKEIIAEVIDKSKTYKGIVRKYTGRELKIEDESGKLIYNENYLENQVVKLFDREGNSVIDPFDVKFESIKYLKKFEGFRQGVSKLSNFSVEDLEDILSDMEIITETYNLEDLSNVDRKDTAKNFQEYTQKSKSFYYINSARNAYIDIFYFGSDKDELIDDLKSFIQKMETYGFYIINGWSYENGFSCEYNYNENEDEYLEASLVFHKKEN